MFKLLRKFWVIATVAAFSFSGLTSCSDDDEPTPESGTTPEVEEKLFPHGRYLIRGFKDIGFNQDGTVKGIVWGDNHVTFEYLEQTTSDSPDVIMTFGSILSHKIFLNDDGFVESMVEIYDDSVEANWEFKYNSDKQLNYLKRIDDEGANEIKFTYSDGDIVAIEGLRKGVAYASNKITYTNSTITSPRDNIGGFMYFTGIYIGGLIHLDLLYLAGLVGYPTKHLPVQTLMISGDKEMTTDFDWTLNSSNLPIVIYIKSGGEVEEATILWL